jgi:hypothetical protein
MPELSFTTVTVFLADEVGPLPFAIITWHYADGSRRRREIVPIRRRLLERIAAVARYDFRDGSHCSVYAEGWTYTRRPQSSISNL